MASPPSNIALTRLPWGRLPRSPVASGVPSQLEVSFRDIMAEQQRESSQDKDFDEYVQNSYVTVGPENQPDTPSSTGELAQQEGGKDADISDVEKSFMQLEDLGLKMVMSFYEDQDFDDAAYELSEQELDSLEDDESGKYYEGLAKKLSTVVEIQSTSVNSTRGSRLQHQRNVDSLIDPLSQRMLGKLKQKGILRGSVGPQQSYKVMHAGKCATTFHATGGMLKRLEDIPVPTNNATMLKLKLPRECAIKVFKTTHETSDPSDFILELDEEQRQVEAKREMSYLNRMTRSGIPCPQVQFVYDHILVTEFLGRDGIPAKKLKDAQDMRGSTLKLAYEQITTNMKILFKACHLVHGNLSENTILWHKRQTYFLSVGDAVNSNRPAALELLYRDCLSISEFFEAKGKPSCRTPQQLFQWITGFDYSGQLLHETCGSDFAMV